MNQSLGLASVLVACVMSGFAGTYFERALKHGPNPRLSVRSMQLGESLSRDETVKVFGQTRNAAFISFLVFSGLWSFLFSAVGVVVERSRRSSSLLAGFSSLTWTVVFIQVIPYQIMRKLWG